MKKKKKKIVIKRTGTIAANRLIMNEESGCLAENEEKILAKRVSFKITDNFFLPLIIVLLP